MEAERTIHRLAAILVADVVAYSRLIAEDKVGALAALNRHREVAFDPVVAQYNSGFPGHLPSQPKSIVVELANRAAAA